MAGKKFRVTGVRLGGIRGVCYSTCCYYNKTHMARHLYNEKRVVLAHDSDSSLRTAPRDYFLASSQKGL